MSWFMFENTDSRDLGLIVTKPVLRPSWAEEITEISIPGRPDSIMQSSGVYQNAEMTVMTAFADPTPESIREVFRVLQGSGRLWLSTAPDEYLNVIIRQNVPEAMALMLGQLPVSMTVLPFAYAVEGTSAELSATDTAVENRGTVYSAPEIIVTGSGEITVTVNGEDFTLKLPDSLSGKTFIIDSEVSVAYYEDGGRSIPVTQYTYGDFPLLHTGTNYVRYSGSVTAGSINVRERYY